MASLARVWSARALTMFYRRVLVLVFGPLRDFPVYKARLPVEIRAVTEDDVTAYARFRGADADEITRRLRRGERCFASWYGGEIVDAGWVAGGVVDLPYMNCLLRLAPGDLYHYDAYTAPQFRGAGLYMARNSFASRLARREGFLRDVALAANENYTAWILLSRSGLRTIGVYHYLRVGPWHRYWGYAVAGEVFPALCAADGSSIPIHPLRVSTR